MPVVTQYCKPIFAFFSVALSLISSVMLILVLVLVLVLASLVLVLVLVGLTGPCQLLSLTPLSLPVQSLTNPIP